MLARRGLPSFDRIHQPPPISLSPVYQVPYNSSSVRNGDSSELSWARPVVPSSVARVAPYALATPPPEANND